MHVSPCIRLVGILLLALPALARAQPIVLDDMSDPSRWKIITAEGVKLATRTVQDSGRTALALDFEFVSGAGFALIQREINTPLPENYEFTFDLRALPGTPSNNLEFKLLDAAAENVWWVNKRAFAFPTQWQTLRYKKRRFEFAWGPSGGAPLATAAKVEFAIASAAGGKGTVLLSDLRFRALPVPKPATLEPVVTDAPGSRTIDLQESREFDGLCIHWNNSLAPAARPVAIEVSEDGQSWSTLATLRDVRTRRSDIFTPDAQSRFIRIKAAGAEGPLPIERVEWLTGLPDQNAFIRAVATRSPAGLYPRWANNLQTGWTVIGLPDSDHEGLISTDGEVEIGKQGFTVQPLLLENKEGTSKVWTWADAAATQSMDAAGLPIFSVQRTFDDADLTITSAAVRVNGQEAIVGLWSVHNRRQTPLTGQLLGTVRPFQVSPPWQFLNLNPGVSPIESISIVAPPKGEEFLRRVVVNAGASVCSSLSPYLPVPFDAGWDPTPLRATPASRTNPIEPIADATGLASALAFADERTLAPGESTWAWFIAPLGCTWSAPHDDLARQFHAIAGEAPARATELLRTLVLADWKDLAVPLPITLPDLPDAQGLLANTRAQLTYIQINRDGPAFQPGSRAYERSWARDGSMTSAAMLEFGHAREARAWIEWFAKYQFPGGKVPCVVDKRGPDPVDEHDSTGQWIYALAEYHRFTGDAAFVRAHWPGVQRAVAYIESLRAQRTTAQFTTQTPFRPEPGKAPVPASAFFGLVPESISHEGYSAKPMHSYWDDFFILKGLKDAAYLAAAVGDTPSQSRYHQLALDFRQDLYRSISAAMKTHGIDYIPGCVELGDFDATSTAVAISPCAEAPFMPKAATERTFEKWWEYFVSRRDDAKLAWRDYTPYELRLVGAMIQLGHKDRAHQMLAFYGNDQHPAGWHQWAEVVTRDKTEPRFIGDIPHTWVGSDYLRSARSIFLYEREGLSNAGESGESLVLLAGVPEAWVRTAPGVAFSGLATHFGKLDLTASASAASPKSPITITLSGAIRMPPLGIEVANPASDRPVRITIDGVEQPLDSAARPARIPATIVFEY